VNIDDAGIVGEVEKKEPRKLYVGEVIELPGVALVITQTDGSSNNIGALYFATAREAHEWVSRVCWEVME
jgi:hypothetical protein